MPANRTVGPEELLLAYQECFNSPAGKIVLAHLVAKFGFTVKSTNVPGDPYGTHINEGHRGVLVYIGKMLSTTTDDLKQDSATVNETTATTREGDDEF